MNNLIRHAIAILGLAIAAVLIIAMINTAKADDPNHVSAFASVGGPTRDTTLDKPDISYSIVCYDVGKFAGIRLFTLYMKGDFRLMPEGFLPIQVSNIVEYRERQNPYFDFDHLKANNPNGTVLIPNSLICVVEFFPEEE